MTNIQAIDLLKGLEQSLDDYCELNDEGKTAFRMAITALEVFGISEQLPSAQPDVLDTNVGDMISRQAAIDAIYHHLPSVSRTRARTMLHEVPSVQPERKTGKWAVGESIFFAGKMHHMPITCSCCGRSALNEPWKFCPNCGAKMGEGGQE